VDNDAPEIWLRSHRSPDGITWCVEDNGPGFPDSLGNRLFEPYATTKPKGTGLGLASVKKIVEEHHGSIEVRNLDSGGASVCITLPLYGESASPDALPPPRARPQEVPVGQAGEGRE
jgi:nitrogen fixation/metabolism regulation signal transduction histidine kinase